MTFTFSKRSKPLRWSERIALGLFGILLALLLAEGLLRLFPQLGADDRPYAVDLGMVEFTVGQGDMFLHMRGLIAPPPHPDEVLSRHHLAWDADGFRVPAHPAQHYDVLALGDSYTEGANVARPWPDVLAEQSGLAVRNLGVGGYGPVQEARVMQEFGADADADYVIIGYFEGNDLSNALKARGFTLPSVLRETALEISAGGEPWRADHDGPFKYPVRIDLNGQLHELVFFDSYMWWLNGEVADYANSLNLQAVGQSWAEIVATAGDACVVIAYLPDRAHIYLPYVVPDDRERLLEGVQRVVPDEDGELLKVGLDAAPDVTTYDNLVRRLDNQRDAVAALAAQMGLPFADLTPAFQREAAQGEILYYIYDTHWNQAGHDLAGAVLADFVADNPCGA